MKGNYDTQMDELVAELSSEKIPPIGPLASKYPLIPQQDIS